MCIDREKSPSKDRPYPKIRGSEAIAGRDRGGRRGVCVEGVDVGQEGAHDSRDALAHVFCSKAFKVPTYRQEKKKPRDSHNPSQICID